MKNAHRLQAPLLTAADYLAIVAAERLAYWLRRDGLPIAVPTFHIPDVYLYLIVPAIFLVFLHESRMKFRAFPLWKMTQAVFHAVLWSVLAIIMLMYFEHVAQVVSRLFVGMTSIAAFLFLILERTALAALFDRYHLFETPVLLVGGGDEADALLSTLAAHGGCGMHCIGLVTDADVPQKASARCAVLGRLSDLERVIWDTGIQNVLVTASGAASDEQVRLVARIQPLVENAIVHGIFKRPEGGRIKTGLIEHKDYFKVYVYDTGIGIPKSKLKKLLIDHKRRDHIGLINVHQRLLSLFGEKSGLHIVSRENKGTLVFTNIPKIESRRPAAPAAIEKVTATGQTIRITNA